ncbi:transposable element Tc1 transposase [Trichonephila clavipes]|nr:transposable element Tc1 transposase [Trichonephila clavipes]
MINGRTRLHVVANGTMTGQRYIDEVLLPHVRLFRGAVGDKFVFMDDNATCHRTFAVQDCLDSEGIQRLVSLAGRNYPPTNKNTLIRALTEEWDKLPQQLLDNVVQKDVGRRIGACYENGVLSNPGPPLEKFLRLPLLSLKIHRIEKDLLWFKSVHAHSLSTGVVGLPYPSGQVIESWQACLKFEPSTTKDPPCRAAMHVKSVES